MRLTKHTDFALRIMVRLAETPGERVAIRTLAADCEAPENHVMKITPTLARAGLVRSVRGRIGGLALARAPDAITLGEIVKVTETGFSPLDTTCGDGEAAHGRAHAALTRAIDAAAAAYLDALHRFRLSDLLPDRRTKAEDRERRDLKSLTPVS